MSRNVLYMIVAVLAVATAVLGYQYYRDRHTTSIELNVGERGISIDRK